MRLFVCLIAPEGQRLPGPLQRRYELVARSRGLKYQWRQSGCVAVLVAGDDSDRHSLVATYGGCIAAGMVRLDNRAALEQWAGCRGGHLRDLELVLRTVARHGAKYVPQFLGDFAFVVWNGSTRTAVAAVDPFALKKLYYTERDGTFAFSSRAEALALEEGYDAQYLAELVAICSPSPELSVFPGIRPVPDATIAALARGKVTLQQYWSPNEFEPEPAGQVSAREAAEVCRQLLTDAVRLRLSAGGGVWAQLSGGLDSSSIVSITQRLVKQGAAAYGLAGTVTYTDRQGTATDEREYSNAIANLSHVRNVTIVDPPIWYDATYEPPHTDQPGFSLPFYPREQRLRGIVRGAGGRVLLTGIGGDELFTGTMLFFADWVARGRLLAAVLEMARRAATGHVSFWTLAYLNAVLPLLPRAVLHRLLRDEGQTPPWMPQATTQRYGLRERTFVVSTYAGRIGHKYHDAIATNVGGIGRGMDIGTLGDDLDVRHPFLYRPLVEFALRLPPELLVRPHARKWILREAMRGILPEQVRTRVGKGTPVELFVESLTAQRSLLEPLVQHPILADLGVVDGSKLRAAFDAAPREPHRKDQQHATLALTLVVEAWLQMRSGRWPSGSHLGSTAVTASLLPSH